jgi:hypothetical protein
MLINSVFWYKHNTPNITVSVQQTHAQCVLTIIRLSQHCYMFRCSYVILRELIILYVKVTNVQTGLLGAHPASYTMGTGSISQGGKAAGAWRFNPRSWPRLK